MKHPYALLKRISSLLTITFLTLLITACGGRMLNKNMAQNLIAGLPGDILNQKDFLVDEVSQTNASNAIVRTRLNAAFRFQKVGGKWIASEVRLGNDQWEDIDDLVAALRRVKEEKTRGLLAKVGEAVEKYCLRTGKLPGFGDYDSLSDILAPEYLNPLIRLDAWERPLYALRLDANMIKILSAGADGKLGSSDDIELNGACPNR
jgi:hypothetical protein